MNRITYDNIDPNVTPEHQKRALNVPGINAGKPKAWRRAKQARHRANQAAKGSYWDREPATKK